MLAIDIGGTWIKSGVVSSDGAVANRANTATPQDYGELVTTLRAIVAAYGENTVVMAIPGVYDKQGDKVLFAPNIPAMSGNSLAADLNLNIPLLIENDANMAALGEYRHGFAAPAGSLIFLTLGTGVGGGIIMDGRLLTGDITGAELGHMTLVAEGRPCGCGKRGCVEKYCSASAIVNDFQEVLGFCGTEDPAEIARLYKKGDFAAFAAFDLFSMHMAHTVATLINIFTPKAVRIGGGLSELSDAFFPRMMELLEMLVFPAFRGKTDIGIATLKNDAALLGCAEWAKLSGNN